MPGHTGGSFHQIRCVGDIAQWEERGARCRQDSMALHSFEQKTVFEFPSFRSAPPQVGERSKKQFPSFRVSAAPPDWREAFSKIVARTIQIPDSAPRPRILGVEQIPSTGSGLPDSRFRASPRILDNWTVSKNRLRPSRIQIPRLAPDFGNWTDFKIQIAPCRIQITRLALQFWKLKDKIQIPNSETAVSVYAPALSPHRLTG